MERYEMNEIVGRMDKWRVYEGMDKLRDMDDELMYIYNSLTEKELREFGIDLASTAGDILCMGQEHTRQL